MTREAVGEDEEGKNSTERESGTTTGSSSSSSSSLNMGTGGETKRNSISLAHLRRGREDSVMGAEEE